MVRGEGCPFSSGEIRKAARAHIVDPRTSLVDHLPTTLNLDPDDPWLTKPNRYAQVEELQLAMPYVIEGDGPAARFKKFILLPTEKGENPYRTLRRSLQATFGDGWERFENDIKSRQLKRIRKRYRKFLKRDTTGRDTDVPVGPEHFKTGVELDSEVPYFALPVGLAIHNSQDNVPHLLGDTEEAKKERYNLACSLSQRSLRYRAVQNLHYTFWTRRRVSDLADWGSLRLEERKDREYVFDNFGGQFVPRMQGDPEPSGPTVGCMALLFKINETDKYWALENAIFASVYEAGEMDLFNPDIAVAAWKQREEIFKLPGVGDVAAGLGEDLTLVRRDPAFRKMSKILAKEFI
ncbi:MAG: hypothetical protein AAB553_06040 [Patescibacteria group bacterium]